MYETRKEEKQEIMAEQTALNSRETAAAVLKEEVRQLNKYRVKINPNLRLLESRYKKVDDAKEDFMNKHYYYGLKASKDLNSTEMTDYLNPILDEANDEMDEVMILMDTLKNTEKDIVLETKKAAEEAARKERRTYELRIANLQYKSDETNVNERVLAITGMLDDEETEVTEENVNLVESLLAELELAMKEQIKSWNKVKSLSEDDVVLTAVFNSEKDVKKVVAEARSKAQAVISKLKPKEQTQSVVEPGNPEDRSSSSDSNMMKLERTKLPKFGGNSRSYARFKKNFQDIVVPNVSNEVQRLFTLKDTCLHGEAKRLVENLTTFNEIWDRLDNKYGYTTDIVNIVINEIESFQLPKIDVDSGFIQLVDIVEKGLQDLAAVQAREEIANAYTVRLLESKLPKRIRGKWVDQESKLVVEREERSGGAEEE